MKWVLLVIISLIISSCSMISRKQVPVAATSNLKKEYAFGKNQLQSHQPRKGIKHLSDLITNHPESDVVDDAAIALGEYYHTNNNYNDSYKAFISVVDSKYASPKEPYAMLMAGRSLEKLGRFDESLSLTNKALDKVENKSNIQLSLYTLRYKLQVHLGDHFDALKSLIYLSQEHQTKSMQKKYQSRAIDIIESRLSSKQLEQIADSGSYGSIRSHAMFRAGINNFEAQNFRLAKSYFSRVLRLSPDTELAEKSQHFIVQINARKHVDKLTIGAVLPLSGRYSSVAQKTLRGLQLGLGIYGQDSSRFKLAVIDSEGNPDTARKAVERLVTEDHVIAIIGSLLSKTSVAVASKSNELGIPSIALSQKSGVTEVGEFVFRNALTSHLQIKQLVETAMKDMNLKRFAILYPNDPYGVEYANLFWDEVLANGGEINAVQTYAPKSTDFSGPIKRLVGTYYIEDRENEYELRLKNWLHKQKVINSRQTPPDDLIPPIVNFDAIFIPDSTKALAQIAPTLVYHDVKDIKFLGTNLWNSKSLIRQAENYVNGSLFIDAILLDDPSFKNSRFYSNYVRTFNSNPSLLAAQAYDAGLLLRQLISGGADSRLEVKEHLGRLNNFRGSLGLLNMGANRELLRPLFSLTVKDGKIKKIKINSIIN